MFGKGGNEATVERKTNLPRRFIYGGGAGGGGFGGGSAGKVE